MWKRNYLSEYRWKKDRINNLSAEDFIRQMAEELLEASRLKKEYPELTECGHDLACDEQSKILKDLKE